MERGEPMQTSKKYVRDLTYSRDFYTATPELWEAYWQAVNCGDWETVEALESGQHTDFEYDP